ncbi:dehydrogenase/reductase SDR family member 7-like [Amphiura filiformis]|uniref:dehydrogenase/reductase SDR family member 7-like n=1 Tax=Amphiura filiformis TaxID=82378 RepID=UPI003B20F5F0
MAYEALGKNGDDLQGKVIWITGASSGIGKALALHLARKGAKLILSARNEDSLKQVKDECLSNYSGQSSDILVLRLDVTDFDSHKEATQNVLKHFSKIDILINNAGRSQRAYASQTILDMDKALLNTNVLGVISLFKAVLPSMLTQGHGQIVNMSSVSGKMGTVFAATYSATKFALHGYFDAVQTEIFDRNIHITNVCPGPVISNIIQNAAQKDFDQPPLKSADGYGERSFWFLMTAERCAELTTIAMANQLGEVWVSRQPILFLTYFAYYLPHLYSFFGKRLGKKRAEIMLESQKQK